MGSKRKIDSNQVKILLSDTILALCRNTLNQYGEVAVEGLLGITLDKEEIFLVSLHEVIQNKSDASKQSTGSSRKHKHSDWSSAVSEDDSDSDSTSSRSKRKRRKKRKRSRSSDSISEKGSKGSKSDGEMNSRKSHSGSRSSQVIVKEEVIDEDEIIVTKENIRRKDNSDVASFHSSGAEYSDQALMNPPAFIIDPQMAQFQASPSMTNTMAQAGPQAKFRSHLNVRCQGSGNSMRFIPSQQNRGMAPQHFLQQGRAPFRPATPQRYPGQGPPWGYQTPIRPVSQAQGFAQMRPGLMGNETPRRPRQATRQPRMTGTPSVENDKQGAVRFSETLTIIDNYQDESQKGSEQVDLSGSQIKANVSDHDYASPKKQELQGQGEDEGGTTGEGHAANVGGSYEEEPRFIQELIENVIPSNQDEAMNDTRKPLEIDLRLDESPVKGDSVQPGSENGVPNDSASKAVDDEKNSGTGEVHGATLVTENLDACLNKVPVSVRKRPVESAVSGHSLSVPEKITAVKPGFKTEAVEGKVTTRKDSMASGAVEKPSQTLDADQQTGAVLQTSDLNVSAGIEAGQRTPNAEPQGQKSRSPWDDLVADKVKVSKDGPYSCIGCGVALESVTLLGAHLHQSHKAYCPPCSICGAQIKLLSSLKRHLLEHVRKGTALLQSA